MVLAAVKDDPAQLGGLGARSGVVEDHAVAADVVILELVVGQAVAVGLGDVDDGHAVAGPVQASARCADYDPVSLGPQWLPEHDVGQQKRQAAFGHAPEVLAGLQGSRRLAGQKGVLAVVHDRVSLQQNLEVYAHAKTKRHFALVQKFVH
jgi:hypothetical protein